MSQRLRGKKKNNQNPESAEGRKIKIRTEIKQRAGKQKINKTKTWFFEKIKLTHLKKETLKLISYERS